MPHPLKSIINAVFSLTLILCIAGTAVADLKSSILSGIEEKYANQAFSADFEQASHLTALDITETATGKAWFSHPGKMRWVYKTPDHHEIITNGQDLWIYRPGENQVMQGSAAAFFQAGSGGAFLSDITRIRKDFAITLGKAGDESAQLLLVPKEPSPDISAIRMTVDLPSHEIQEVVTENPYGDTTKFFFTNIRFNTLDPLQFEFKIPGDADIIEMN